MTVPQELRVHFSTPLLLMFLLGAERCCRLVLASLPFPVLLQSCEPSGNALHALLIGCARKLRPEAAFHAILAGLLDRYSEEELRQLNQCSGHLGLRPVELAAHMGEFALAERLLCNGVLRKISATICGPDIVVTFDLGEYDISAEESRFFVSPLSLLGESLTIARLRKIKASNILRPMSLFHAWEEVLLQTSMTPRVQGTIWTLITFVIVIVTGNAFLRKRLAYECGYPDAEQPSSSERTLGIVSMFLVLFNCTYNFLISLMLFCRQLSLFRKVGYKYKLFHQSYFMILCNFGVCMLLTWTGAFILLYFVTRPDHFCGQYDYYYIAGAIAVIHLSLIYSVMFTLQIWSVFNYFVANFFQISIQLIPFLIFYILIVAVFARIFESIINLRGDHVNATLTDNWTDADPLFKDFGSAVYTTFRLSLNIVDFSRASTDKMTMIMHWIYVMILPFMIFNYIIGVISAQLSSMTEVREERALVYRAMSSLFIVSVNRSIDLMSSVYTCKKKSTTVSICVPITDPCLSEKSLEHAREELEIVDV